MSRNVERVIRSACQASHCECGVLVHVKNGKVVKIRGDLNHPLSRGYICPKGRAQAQLLYHSDRLKYPLRRLGQRGSGRWKRASWDEVLDNISRKLTEIKERYGPESITAIHGTGPRPTLHSTNLLLMALGSPNVISVDLHICYIPSWVAERWTYGDTVLMDKGPDYLNSNCIMVIGGNPLVSHPPYGLRILEAKQKRLSKLIVVDPRYTELAAKADLWLQVRPGTDAALVLGMIKIVIEEELYDQDFVNNWCYGFDRLKDSVAPYSIDKVAQITWIPAEKIQAAARLYATTRPASLHHRVALEHNINSTQTCRTLAILAAITGNLDVPGGNVMPMHIDGFIRSTQLMGEGSLFRPSVEVQDKRIGAKEYPLTSGHDAVIPFVVAPLAHEALRTGNPYPIKAMFCAGGNPILNQQNTRSWWQAMKDRLELIVVSEFFMTPTAELADYVLPATTWLERDELCDIMYNNFITARQRIVEPLHECWDDMKIAIELAKRIPWANRRFLPWDNVDEFNEARVKGTGMTFEELKDRGYLLVPMKYKKYEEKGFDTPTGKVELFATGFVKYGLEPLPHYMEPPESPVSSPEVFEEYPLILYTGGRYLHYFHSEGRQIPNLRKQIPDPVVEINPETAKLMNIEDGDWVWIETPQVLGERVRLRAKLTSGVHPKMVHARHGWWFPEKPAPEHGCFESNINVILTDDPPRGKACASVRSRGTLCRITKLTCPI
ncbi:molybdopterin-dependent oxidoreductase [Chloroflexota bacterium]